MATPWTYFLRLSLSSVILIDSSAGSPGRLSGKFATDLLAHFSVELSVVYVTVSLVFSTQVICVKRLNRKRAGLEYRLVWAYVSFGRFW